MIYSRVYSTISYDWQNERPYIIKTMNPLGIR